MYFCCRRVSIPHIVSDVNGKTDLIHIYYNSPYIYLSVAVSKLQVAILALSFREMSQNVVYELCVCIVCVKLNNEELCFLMLSRLKTLKTFISG